MQRKDIFVIGGSAGGVDAIRVLLEALPADFRGSLFVVIHTAPHSPGVLAKILDEAGPLVVRYAEHDERIEPGRVYVAPPDHHMILMPGKVRLTRGPKENRFRPAVDPLFRSAAQIYGPRVVGVVLSGGLDDGTSGLWTIKQLGGTAVVQDPDEALAPSMPLSALRNVRVDHTVRIADLAPLLSRFAVMQADMAEGGAAVPDDVDIEVQIASETRASEAGVLRLGRPSIYACPECHGVLLQVKNGVPLRFRCHTGHAFTLESLFAEMDEAIEDSLWNAVRALEERELLAREAAEHARTVHGDAASALLELAEEAQRRAELVRQVVLDRDEDEQSASGGG